MINEARYIELENSFIFSKAVLEVFREDVLALLDFWRSVSEAEEASG